MKIAVSASGNVINEHFGHSKEFLVYSFDEYKNVVEQEVIHTNGTCGCRSGIASLLSSKEVTVILTGKLGHGALAALSRAGIEVIRGCSGDPAVAAKDFARGRIRDSGETCSHHSHEHHH